MINKRSEGQEIMAKAVSAVLIFWLSSVLVLACCGTDIFTVSGSNLVVTDEASCPMGKGHECCKKEQNDGNKFSEPEKDKADCCVFKPQRTVAENFKTVKISKQSQAVAETVKLPQPTYFIKNFYQPAKFYQSAIRNRGSTYKQNCVFRI